MGRNNRKLGTADSVGAAELIRSDAPRRGGEAVFCCIRQGIGERQREQEKVRYSGFTSRLF